MPCVVIRRNCSKCFARTVLVERRKYHAISPILNHPGCFTFLNDPEWMPDDYGDLELTKNVMKRLHKETWQSPKFIILAHVLAMADKLHEKNSGIF